MANPQYDVFFAGGLLEGVSREQALANLATLFKTQPEKLSHLFSGKPVTLKKAIDKDTALKYKAALHKAGVIVAIKIHQPAARPAAPERKQAPANAQPSPSSADPSPAEQTAATGLSLAPTGSDVLTDAERSHHEEREIDTSAYKLASAFQEPENLSTPAPPPPDTGHLSVAEVGSDLCADADTETDAPALDLSHLTLAEVGTMLEELKPDAPVLDPDISAITLAPEGSDVMPEDYQKPAPPPAPDVDHIRLSDDA